MRYRVTGVSPMTCISADERAPPVKGWIDTRAPAGSVVTVKKSATWYMRRASVESSFKYRSADRARSYASPYCAASAKVEMRGRSSRA